jgi:gluconolactonase
MIARLGTYIVRLFIPAVLAALVVSAFAQRVQDPPFGRPDAVVDLSTNEGAELVRGTWRYHDVQIVHVESRSVVADLKPTGTPNRTYDYMPHAGIAGFDDSQWESIPASTLDQRRSTDRIRFNWYRIQVQPYAGPAQVKT